jgi:putative hydrolase of the HAD superfamily
VIKTIFFDLDNVIIDEDLLYFKYHEILWMFLRKLDWKWTFEKLIEIREEIVKEYDDPNPHLTIAREYLSERGFSDYKSQISYFNRKNRNKYIKIIPGISYAIRNLNHHYNLGVIANQSSENYDFLTNFKLSLPFQTVAISSKLKFSKPNPEIFLWALEKSKTNPDEAVMIGDRWDLDILPAKRLGMNTIKAIFDYKTKGIFPQSDREKLYFSSVQKLQTKPEKRLFQPKRLTPIARNPNEILTRISELEGQPTSQPTSDLELNKNIEETNEEKGLWDIFKDIMEEV